MSNFIAEAVGIYEGEKISLRIFSPERAFEDSTEFICRFSIIGSNLIHKNGAIGLDSLQALVLALKMVGSFFRDEERFVDNPVSWVGGKIDLPVFEQR